MSLIAVTDIDDGTKVISAGSHVSLKDFSAEVLDHLKSLGSVVNATGPAPREQEEHDAEVAKLKAALAKALEENAKLKEPKDPEPKDANVSPKPPAGK